MKTTILLATIALSGLGLAAQATLMPAFDVPAGQPNYGPIAGAGAPVNLGLEFIANGNLKVDALGFYYQGAGAGEWVGLYQEVNGVSDLVVKTYVRNTGSILDLYYWQRIRPVELVSGDTYTVVAETGANSWYGSDGVPPSVDLPITYLGAFYDYASVLSNPFDPAPHDGYFGPNFAVCPDGGLTAGLLGGALIGIGALRRKLSI
jgi:hypothetical protein